MTELETMAYLKCSATAIYNMLKNGRLKKDGKEIDNDSIYELTGNAKEVYKISEYAEIHGISRYMVQAMINKGELATFKIGAGTGNGGIRIAIPEQKPKAEKKIDPIEKPTKGEKIVVRKIKADDVEVHIVVKGNQEASKTKLIKDFIKAWFDNCSLEESLEKLMELL